MKKFKHSISTAATVLFVGLCLTACGNSKTGSTSGNNDSNAVEDVADGAADAVDDVADDIGNAVDDLVGDGGFNNYADAHDYFLDTMGSYHADANFEIRDEDKNLNDYQEGSKGYHFNLYDTSSSKDGELFGEFYVDANSGMIYKKGADGSISEYPGTESDTNANSGQKSNHGGSANNNSGSGKKSNHGGSANNNSGSGGNSMSGSSQTGGTQSGGSGTGVNMSSR